MTTLRPVEPEDIEIFYDHEADPVASEMAAFPSRERAAHFEHWTKRVIPNPTGLVRTVIADGSVAGNVLSWIDSQSGRRFVGYWLGRDFWGRGIATEAVRRYVEELADRPLYAHVAVTNVASQRVLEKNGFVVAAETETGPDGIEERLYVLN